jgi:multidrug efflux system membrane fusion protein
MAPCKNKPIRRFLPLILPFFWLAVAALVLPLLTGCPDDTAGNSAADGSRKQIAVPVTVSIAEDKSVPVQVNAVGNVQAYSTVSIKSQVEGILTSVHFREGEAVKKGDLLFTIDPRPFEAELNQAKANLARDEIQLENAKRQVERNASVVEKGYVSREQYDQLVANAAVLKAVVQADRAAVENAELKLKYCFIRSPINGYTGQLKVNQGNLVKANDNDNPMVIINQVSPIFVTFFIPERNLAEIKSYMKSRQLCVEVIAQGANMRSVRGEVCFLDNAVNQSAGTICLKAVFNNKEKVLWPGQFVDVLLTLTSQEHATVIPSRAVQMGQEGPYVFVVKPDLKAEYRPIRVGRMQGDEVIVEEGLKPEEKVVTDGQLRLRSGFKVRIVEKTEKATKENG